MFVSQLKSTAAAVAVLIALGAGGFGVRTLAADGPAKGTPPAAAERLTLHGWGTAIDPDGDCKFAVAKNGLTISVPGRDHGLSVERGRMNAPRVLQEIEGDFIIQVRVSGDFPKGAKSVVEGRRPFFGAGILVYKDDHTYVRLERAELNLEGKQFHYANWELRNAGEWPRAGDANDGAIDPAAPVWLRVERRGGKVYGYHSADGTTWTALDPIDVSLPAKVRVGVCAGHNTSIAYAPEFEGLQLYRAIVSMPVPPDATSRAGAALLNAGTITISGGTFKTGALTVNGTTTLGRLLTTTQIPSGTLTLTGTGVLNSATTLTGTIINGDPAAGFKVGEIKIIGNSQIAEEAIRERLGLTPGKTITPAELQQAERRLRESRIFKHPPTVTAVDPAGAPVKDIVITIQNQ